MNKKIIVFGIFLAVYSILLVPNISAIGFKTVTENLTNYNENELIDAIKDRIEQSKFQNFVPKLTFNGDPDGPFKGGLDDIFDWLDLFFGIQFVHELAKMFKSQWLKKAYATGSIIQITLCIIVYDLYTYSTITSLGDAFDIFDPDKDGY